MQNIKKVLIFISGFLISFFVTFCIYFTVHKHITFLLKGNETYTVEVGTTLKDDGLIAKLFNKNLTKKVQVQTDLNLNRLGTYSINYSMNYLGKTYNLKRNVSVIDEEAPTIILNGDEEITLYLNDTYTEQGAHAIDNYDDDLTESILIEGNVDTSREGTYQLNYQVKDSSGNKSSIIRTITVKQRPIVYSYSNTNNHCDLDSSLINYLKEKNYNVSVGYYNLNNGNTCYFQENKSYYGASLIKTLDALYLYDNNLLTADLKPYVEKAISVSDNSAHQYLVKTIGRETLKQYGISLGAPNTLSGKDNYGYTTVLDQMVYMKKLYSMSAIYPDLKQMFINTYWNSLKFNNLDIMHKWGYWETYFHDVGIVLDESPYIIVVLSRYRKSNGEKVVNDISQKVYEYHLQSLSF